MSSLFTIWLLIGYLFEPIVLKDILNGKGCLLIRLSVTHFYRNFDKIYSNLLL